MLSQAPERSWLLLALASDFRSAGGLYADGALFEEAAFIDSRRAQLLKTALRIRDRAADSEPTETRRWLASLRCKLLRCYTQNVDMLEAKAGLVTGLGRRFDCVPLHGSLANLKCHLCHEAYEWQDYRCHIEESDTEDGYGEDDADRDIEIEVERDPYGGKLRDSGRLILGQYSQLKWPIYRMFEGDEVVQTATVCHAFGEEQPTSCDGCQNGPFQGCVVYRNQFKNACSNCIFTGDEYCEWRTRKSKGQPSAFPAPERRRRSTARPDRDQTKLIEVIDLTAGPARSKAG
ncbi:hypothetical protein B0T17DRAFT_617706 [Bombardia bombarda]|uniref:Deacetylase sirtuin-type domain-containing protein n=1 Tax=Bombardia bombarda TaxID=252184 RepID=A0AA39WTD7_9PEZI|nr:hypothetical protein B0T17DRAFT_617706 [Bombardia bombarda]